MRFDERYPEFNPCKERPAPPAAENVIRVLDVSAEDARANLAVK